VEERQQRASEQLELSFGPFSNTLPPKINRRSPVASRLKHVGQARPG